MFAILMRQVLTVLLTLWLAEKTVAQPTNAYQMGNTWYCNNGYKREGDGCVEIEVPANAWVRGSQWYCNNGYKREGDSCVEIKVPANAWVRGSQWYCNLGYKKVGNSCQEMTDTERKQQLVAIMAVRARAKNKEIDDFDFSLSDIESKCEVWKWSDSYGDIECSGSRFRVVERKCEVYFSDSETGEMECRYPLRVISGDCTVSMYSNSYGNLDC